MADKFQYRQLSQETKVEIQDLLRRERQRSIGDVGEPIPATSPIQEFGGRAKVTTAITAATDSGGNRTDGQGVVSLMKRNRTTNVQEAYRTGVVIWNTTKQTTGGAVGNYVQYIVDEFGDVLWNVADCP